MDFSLANTYTQYIHLQCCCHAGTTAHGITVHNVSMNWFGLKASSMFFLSSVFFFLTGSPWVWLELFDSFTIIGFLCVGWASPNGCCSFALCAMLNLSNGKLQDVVMDSCLLVAVLHGSYLKKCPTRETVSNFAPVFPSTVCNLAHHCLTLEKAAFMPKHGGKKSK